jgi:hypothetical protein
MLAKISGVNPLRLNVSMGHSADWLAACVAFEAGKIEPW